MSDTLTIIMKVISEHHAIREHVKLAGDTVNDFEAFFTLQQAASDWAQSSTQVLTAKQNQLQQAISLLGQGLKNHFSFEQSALSPIFGELLMKAILLEHGDISRQIDVVKAILAGTELETMEQKALLARRSEIQQAVSSICQAIEGHATHEEIILRMIRKALEREGY